jgi:hypothetical protein
MFDSIPEPQQEAQSAPPQTAARERMGVLRRVSEIGLRIAERLDRQSEVAASLAEAAILPDDVQAACAKSLHETARAFAQVARAVSIAIALEDKIERGPPLESPPSDLVCPVPRESRLKARRDEVEHGVRQAIDLSAMAEPRIDVDRLCRDLDNLLAREMAEVDAFLSLPTEEIVTRLCQRIGVDPESMLEDPSPDRGGVMGDGSWSEPCAIANDLAIAAKNAGAQAEAGPVAKQREGGVTDLRAPSTEPPLRPPRS